MFEDYFDNHHLTLETDDWEIENMTTKHAKYELDYQYDNLNLQDNDSTLNGFQHKELIQKSICIRDQLCTVSAVLYTNKKTYEDKEMEDITR